MKPGAFQKTIAFFLSLVMISVALLAPISTVYAADKNGRSKPAPVNNTQVPAQTLTQPVTTAPTVDSDEDDLDGQGVKGYLVRLAVEAIAAAVRYGGPVLTYIVGKLDKPAAQALSRYSGYIAGKLDYIATIPDLTANMVRTYIFNFLAYDLHIGYGNAQSIADAIKSAINWLVL
jgi:hypothetical protein